jgi:hypothetical protein
MSFIFMHRLSIAPLHFPARSMLIARHLHSQIEKLGKGDSSRVFRANELLLDVPSSRPFVARYSN